MDRFKKIAKLFDLCSFYWLEFRHFAEPRYFRPGPWRLELLINKLLTVLVGLAMGPTLLLA
jgi:hypothetical protein